MRFLNEPIFSNASQVTSNSGTVDSSYMTSVSAQAFFTDGAAAGTLKLQMSNDHANPTNWNDITGATVTVAAGATSAIPKIDICCQWIRAVWTSTGGAGTFTANLKTLGF